MKKIILKIISMLLFTGLYYYLFLPPINIQSIQFWSFIIFLLLFYFTISSTSLIVSSIKKYDHFIKTGKPYKDIEVIKEEVQYKKSSKIIGISTVGLILLIIIVNFIFSPMFNANSYATRINIVESENFASEIAPVDFNKIPLLDKDSSQKLGDRKMGEISEWVSQFSVSTLYTQVNYNGEIARVTPLEYADIIKYFSNKDSGVKGYITVNSVNGESTLVELDEGMHYMPSAFFGEDLDRKLRFSYPTEIFAEKTFEIDEEGNPYWIVPTVKYTAIGLRKEIDGVIVLDAVTGESVKYNLDEVPSWIDHVYPSDLIIEQVNNWGTYVNGFINSIFGQKDVVNATEGYTYLSIEDDIYLYTGITSVAADESNLGFVLVNLRTKESIYYPAAGAEEFSAMSSAEGLVQEKGYISTFPLLINLNNKPTYLMSLKDAAGLVKMYAFVDVVDYQIVSVSDSSLGIENAASEYLNLIGNDTNLGTERLEKTITVKEITEAIIDGNTHYFIIDNDNNKYEANIKINESFLPFVQKGDKITITYLSGNVNVIKTIN